MPVRNYYKDPLQNGYLKHKNPFTSGKNSVRFFLNCCLEERERLRGREAGVSCPKAPSSLEPVSASD